MARVSVRHLASAREALDVAGAMLAAREIDNSIVLAALSRKAGKNEPAEAIACAHDEGGAAAAVFVKDGRPAGLLSAGPRAAIEALADDLSTTLRSLGGVHGESEAVAAFSSRWRARTGDRSVPGLETTVYLATSVVAPRLPKGTPRLAEPHDVPIVAPWFDAFAAEAGVHVDGSSESMARRNVDGGTLWVWTVDDALVCMSLLIDATPSMSRVAWVYTPKDRREHGYASALVAAQTSKALGSGKTKVTLNADVKNATSNGIYLKIGYRVAGAASTANFERP